VGLLECVVTAKEFFHHLIAKQKFTPMKAGTCSSEISAHLLWQIHRLTSNQLGISE